MLIWFTQNLATILISLVLILAVAAIVRGLVRDRRRGKSPCGCSACSCSCGAASGDSHGSH